MLGEDRERVAPRLGELLVRRVLVHQAQDRRGRADLGELARVLLVADDERRERVEDERHQDGVRAVVVQHLQQAGHAAVRGDERLVVRVLAHVAQGAARRFQNLSSFIKR